MNYLQKLTDLVCTEKDIDKVLKELRFGTEIKSGYKYGKLAYWDCDKKFKNGYIVITNETRVLKLNLREDSHKIEIIGNPLELHHLMWYCELKEKYYLFGNLNTSKQIQIGYEFIHYDKTKPLSQQSEEVLKNIFEALAS